MSLFRLKNNSLLLALILTALVVSAYSVFAQVLTEGEILPVEDIIEPPFEVLPEPDEVVVPILEPIDLEPVIADFFQARDEKFDSDLMDSFKYVVSFNNKDYYVNAYYWDLNSSSCIDLPEHRLVICGSFSIELL